MLCTFTFFWVLNFSTVPSTDLSQITTVSVSFQVILDRGCPIRTISVARVIFFKELIHVQAR